jgi:hypothetical protein
VRQFLKTKLLSKAKAFIYSYILFTDSLCSNIRNQDGFKIMKDKKYLFDLSYDSTNNKIIGK